MVEKVDAVVVGAGLSGLFAARQLVQAGLSVRILEARERIGGRVWSHEFERGATVDLGGQWIAPGQERINRLVQEFGLETVPTYAAGDAIVLREGESLRYRSGSLPFGLFGKVDAAQLGWRLDRLARRARGGGFLQEGRAATLDQTTAASWLESSSFSRDGGAYWRYLVESGLCVGADEVSALEVVRQIASIGGLGALASAEAHFLVGGAQSVAEGLGGNLRDFIITGAPVESLEHRGGSLRVSSGARTFAARNVILALPPQLIKKIRSDMPLAGQPHGIVLGRVIKMLVVYDRAWWRDQGLSGSVSAPEGPITTVIDGSGPTGAPGILVALANGRHADKLGGKTGAELQAIAVSHIEKSFGVSGATRPSVVSVNWSSEPWSLGGYASRRAPGGWISREQSPRTDELAQGVHIAGTESADEWRSYMEGALQSGERAAGEVLADVSQT